MKTAPFCQSMSSFRQCYLIVPPGGGRSRIPALPEMKHGRSRVSRSSQAPRGRKIEEREF